MSELTNDCLWLIGAALLGYVYRYLRHNYDDVTLFELLYYIKVPMKGANTGPFTREIPGVLLTIIASVGVATGIDFILPDRGIPAILGKVLLIAIVLAFMVHFHLARFLYLTFSTTKLYEEEYVDPKAVKLVFPEKKRNLIYIFMESMETCYSELQNDKVDYMPELSKLASTGTNFKGNKKINGAFAVPGATYTTGAMLSHLSGVPISQSFPSNLTGKKKFLPNITILGDILKKAGYNQEFVLGSDIAFGGREPLMREHGEQRIFDYIEAKKEGRIPQDYRVFWGMEDEKLFENAKLELEALSKEDAPFALTVLTVDTHFLDGYKCRLCPDTFDTQYGNVIACSSKQVFEFVEWIKAQPFYDNTTIVLAGDHPTMDSGFIKKAGLKGQDRKSYVTYLNLPEGLQDVAHEYTSMDLFPTTLASLGVTIQGDKLGLGRNLFSNEETLLEKYGSQGLEDELTKKSKYYKSFL